MHATLRIVAAGALAAAAFLGGALRPVATSRPQVMPVVETGTLSARATGGSTAETIAALEGRLREVPSDWRSAAALGLAFVQRARITSDPSTYPRAEQLFRRSLALSPENADALVGMGSLALARHDFAEALVWGRRAVSANPYGVAGQGVVGDALVELGRYREAFRAFQKMANIRPGLSAYSRASYARELQGDLPGAIRLMRMAEQSAGSPEDAAWAAFELGELFWSTGQLGRAETAYRRAVLQAPAFIGPRAGLGRLSWARGRVHDAIRRYRRLVARFPAPEYVAALGDLYVVAGRPELAEDQFALVRAEQKLLETNGVNVDVEAALFDADHGRPRAALRAARAAWSERKSTHAADAVAWALHRSGRSRMAASYATRALALDTKNALFQFHAAMIELRLGHLHRAKALLSEALRTNPHFSIAQSADARRVLARLEARR